MGVDISKRQRESAGVGSPRLEQQPEKTSNLTQTDIDCRLISNPKLTGACPMLAHRAHWVPTREDTTRTGRSPLAAGFERAVTSGSDSVTRQRAPVGDSLNDEQ